MKRLLLIIFAAAFTIALLLAALGVAAETLVIYPNGMTRSGISYEALTFEDWEKAKRIAEGERRDVWRADMRL